MTRLGLTFIITVVLHACTYVSGNCSVRVPLFILQSRDVVQRREHTVV